MPSKGEDVAGRYLLLERIDSGGQGTVWKAKDFAPDLEKHGREHHRQVTHDKIMTDAGNPYYANNIIQGEFNSGYQPLPPPDCAVKFFDKGRPDVVKRLIEECKALDMLNIIKDPRIIRLIDYSGDDRIHLDNPPWLVMELIDGGDLSKKIKNNQFKLNHTDSLRLFRDIVDALRIAHEHNPQVLHRDLKPPNILLRENGQPVISDFGICIIIDDLKIELTRMTNEFGARNYIAPELRSVGFQLEPTPASDIYSLGKLLYCMLSGGKVMDREDYNVGEKDLRKWGGASEGLDAIYDKIFSKTICENRDDRFQKCADLLVVIDELLEM